MERAVNVISRFQYDVPIVLGIISEKIRINIVTTAETIPKGILFNAIAACLPTPAAPIVLAMVFNDKIAAKGCSGDNLYFLNNVALRLPSSSRIVI